MTFLNLKCSAKDDPEVSTIDWIVLTAALVGVAVVTAASIQAGSDGLVANLGTYVGATQSF